MRTGFSSYAETQSVNNLITMNLEVIQLKIILKYFTHCKHVENKISSQHSKNNSAWFLSEEKTAFLNYHLRLKQNFYKCFWYIFMNFTKHFFWILDFPHRHENAVTISA